MSDLGLLAIGVDSDPTMVHFVRACRVRGITLNAINLREVVVDGDWRFVISERGGTRGTIWRGPNQWDLHDFKSLYCRPINLATDRIPSQRARWHGLMAGLTAWADQAPCLVVNRPSNGSHNGSKPLHEAFLAELGFRVPDSLTSCDKEELTEFAASGRVIAKAVSGTRANSREVKASDFLEYEPLAGPVHLQRLIEGDDVRAHVTGQEVVSIRMRSSVIDYRLDRNADYERTELPSETNEGLTLAAAQMGLSFVGWDLKVDKEGGIWCLEANPMPGYSHYDTRSGGAISEALLRLLRRG